MGRCRNPMYLTHSLAAEMFELRRTICMRRMEANNWELSPPRDPPAACEGKSNLLREVAPRHIGRARHRRLRSQAAPIPYEMGPITLPSSTTLQLPSGDKNAPGLLPRALELHPPFGPS